MDERFIKKKGKLRQAGQTPRTAARASGRAPAGRLEASTSPRFVSLCTASGSRLAARVRIAGTFASRFIGLLAHGGLSEDEGLLLVPGGTVHTFGMRFSIDLVFLDQEMRVVAFCRRVQPCRISLAPPRTAFALELAAGRIDAARLGAGDRLVALTSDATYLTDKSFWS